MAAHRDDSFVSLKFVLAVFEWQAYDTLAYFFVLAGLWAIVVNRALWGAVLLALAAAIKATPLVFLPYLVVKRRFLAAAIFTVVFIVLWLAARRLCGAQEHAAALSRELVAADRRSGAGERRANPGASFW